MIKISGRIVLGIILVGLGLVLFLGVFGVEAGDFTLIIIAGAFIAAYFQSTREGNQAKVGLLIPGAIILMVGLHSFLSSNFRLGDMKGPLFFFLLGTAFWLVYFVHSIHLQHNWPAVTGGIIYLFAIFILTIEYWEKAADILKYVWGFALLGLGVWIIIRTVTQERK